MRFLAPGRQPGPVTAPWPAGGAGMRGAGRRATRRACGAGEGAGGRASPRPARPGRDARAGDSGAHRGLRRAGGTDSRARARSAGSRLRKRGGRGCGGRGARVSRWRQEQPLFTRTPSAPSHFVSNKRKADFKHGFSHGF